MSGTLNALISSVGTLTISSVTAWVSVKSTRKTVSDKALQAMKDEVALLKDWPEGSGGRLELQRHLEWLARRYIADQTADMRVKIRWMRAIVAILLGVAVLSVPTVTKQPTYLLGSPLGIACIYWSIREMAGSNARRKLHRTSMAANVAVGGSDGEDSGDGEELPDARP